MARKTPTGFSPEQRGQRDRRIDTKPRRHAQGWRCSCDECEGLMAEGLVYGPDDGFRGWGGND
jgi:hypothetical protein